MRRNPNRHLELLEALSTGANTVTALRRRFPAISASHLLSVLKNMQGLGLVRRGPMVPSTIDRGPDMVETWERIDPDAPVQSPGIVSQALANMPDLQRAQLSWRQERCTA